MDKHNGGAAGGIKLEETSEGLPLVVPEEDWSTLVDMAALSQRNVCEGDAVPSHEFRRRVERLAQLIYQQAYAYGGADAVWKNPQDGSHHHPTFPEQDGEAWHAWNHHRNECLEMGVVGLASGILARRDQADGCVQGDVHAHYEHLLLDILEQRGLRGLIQALIDLPASGQQYS